MGDRTSGLYIALSYITRSKTALTPRPLALFALLPSPLLSLLRPRRVSTCLLLSRLYINRCCKLAGVHIRPFVRSFICLAYRSQRTASPGIHIYIPTFRPASLARPSPQNTNASFLLHSRRCVFPSGFAFLLTIRRTRYRTPSTTVTDRSRRTFSLLLLACLFKTLTFVKWYNFGFVFLMSMSRVCERNARYIVLDYRSEI